jgi:hypothetical protein
VSEKMVLSRQKRVLLLLSSFLLLQSTPTCEGESERVDKGGSTVASRLVARKEKIENTCARARAAATNQPREPLLEKFVGISMSFLKTCYKQMGVWN